MRVYPDGSIEVTTPEEALALSRLMSAHKGDQQAPGSTGGAPAPKSNRGRKSGARGRRVAVVKAEQPRSARPVAAEKGGPPTPRRAAKGAGTPAEKRCPKCGETKPADAFGRNAAQASRLQAYCKACRVHGKKADAEVGAPALPTPRLSLIGDRVVAAKAKR